MVNAATGQNCAIHKYTQGCGSKRSLEPPLGFDTPSKCVYGIMTTCTGPSEINIEIISGDEAIAYMVRAPTSYLLHFYRANTWKNFRILERRSLLQETP